MRALHDASGRKIRLERIHGHCTYSGLLEGTAYLSHRFHLLRGQNWAKEPGTYVHGLDERQRAVETLPRDTDEWVPREEWCAKLVGEPDFALSQREFLWVHWHQEGGDPMQRLVEIVAGLHFERIGSLEPYTIDD